jgi:hypothetical protein
MKNLRNIAIMALGLFLSVMPEICFSAGEEEFVGPFANWGNVKTDFGAVGNGVADDTAAIQAAFNSLQTHTQFSTVYFPAGTYRITSTIHTDRTNVYNCTGVTIVGEDPATTIIRWAGPTNGIMVGYDAWYSKISRLTLDGAGKAAVALAYVGSWSTYNETSDMIFQDVHDGMQMGTNGVGQAENTVLRCKFKRCADAGLRTTDWNSMDIWLWYCQFEDCGYGVYNYCGNFHVYQSIFLRSKNADIGKLNLMVFSFVNNVSIGSACFLDFHDGFTSGSPVSITGNRIINTTGNFAIRLSNGGPYLVMDNIIKSRSGKNTPEVEMTWGDQLFVSNTYTIANAVSTNGRFRVIGDQVVNPGTVDTNPPAMPATPVNYHRTVFEPSGSDDTVAIQAAINSAAALKGNNPVVHLPVHSYYVTNTLVIPAGCDMQIVGDGAFETASSLKWASGSTGVVFRLPGPSKAVVRDLYIQPVTGTGIKIENCDQPGGRIFGDQLNLAGNASSGWTLYGFFANGVENADILLRCTVGGEYSKTWINVVGGPQLQSGATTPGQISLLTAASQTAQRQYNVVRGGRLVARSVYHERSTTNIEAVALNDSGTLSIDATKFSYDTTGATPMFGLSSFNGQFTLLTSLLWPWETNSPRVEIKGDGSRSSALCAANIFYENISNPNADSVWKNTASPAATNAAMLNCNANISPSPYFISLANRGTASDAFVLKMLQPIRETRVWLPSQTDASLTDVRLYRLRIIPNAGSTGIGVEACAGTLPAITNNPASAMDSTALLNGYLASTGGMPTAVYVCWGTNNGGKAWGSWARTNYLGVNPAGPLSTSITALLPTTAYFYCFYASNWYGETWAPVVGSFTTLFNTGITMSVSGYVGLNFGSNWKSMLPSDSAGAVVASANWNNLSGGSGSSSAIAKSDGAASGISAVWNFAGTYSARGSAANGDETMMWGYLDNSRGIATIAISNISSYAYDVYVYFGSDTDGRIASVGINGISTYTYATYSGPSHSFPASYTNTTDMSGVYPLANYAVWSNRTESSFVMTCTKIGVNSGVHGVQLVLKGMVPNNAPPVVSITSPTNGAVFTAGANITIKTTASDSDGSVSRVDFYQGSTKLAQDASSPYTYTWNAVAAGFYSLTAQATDNNSATTTSTAVNISVGVNTNQTPHSVPYTWLSLYGIVSNQDQLENSDPDGDGMATWQEYYAGTDPTNRNSRFSLSIINTAGQVILRVASIQASAGKTRYYDVEMRTNLMTGAWQPVLGYTNTIGDGSIITCTNATQNQARFYRAKARLQP